MDVRSAEQRAYHLRKLRTRMTRLDVNRDGYVSREDFEMMADRLVANSDLTNEQAESTRASFLSVADDLGFKPGVCLSADEAATRLHESMLSTDPEKAHSVMGLDHSAFFDAIDTNNDGLISVDEYKVYFNAIGPGVAEEDVMRSFNAIDANKDGVISREEFAAAAFDFLFGFEPTETSEVFFGPLLP